MQLRACCTRLKPATRRAAERDSAMADLGAGWAGWGWAAAAAWAMAGWGWEAAAAWATAGLAGWEEAQRR